MSKPSRQELGKREFADSKGQKIFLDYLYKANYADCLLVMKGDEVLYDRNFNHGFNELTQHIWHSATKAKAFNSRCRVFCGRDQYNHNE